MLMMINIRYQGIILAVLKQVFKIIGINKYRKFLYFFVSYRVKTMVLLMLLLVKFVIIDLDIF